MPSTATKPARLSDTMRGYAGRYGPAVRITADNRTGEVFLSIFRFKALSALLYERADGSVIGKVYKSYDGTEVEVRDGTPAEVFDWAYTRTDENYRGGDCG